jgi:lipopolysaccharide/colanic/teichoic acid biosynthesis glycosyltransferase
MVPLTKPWPSKSSEPDRSSGEIVYTALKRVMDSLVALIALIVMLPVMILIGVAIVLDSPGPIFYTQERVGVNRRRLPPPALNGKERRRRSSFGRTFKIIKFRSMVSDAERGTGVVWAVKGDPRVTRVGRLLRRSHLDELPQLLNVLLGHMSIVGPRPERPEIVDRLVRLIPGYEQRFSVLPGITGLAQVEYCYDHNLHTAARKLQFDLYYIQYSGLLLDLKLMAATTLVMARANGGGAQAVAPEMPADVVPKRVLATSTAVRNPYSAGERSQRNSPI